MARPASVMQWIPPIGGIGVALFLAVFALDVFTGGPWLDTLLALVMHLVPSFLVLGVVALAWRWPAVGAVAFPVLALVYAVVVHWRLDWIAAIGGPLLLLGVLYFVSWRGARARVQGSPRRDAHG
jgi:hypothetical protein